MSQCKTLMGEKMNDATSGAADPSPQPQVSPDKLARYIAQARSEQNPVLAVIAGAVAALIGALLWALITLLTNFQIGFMAIGVGFLVGKAVGKFGKGIDTIYGVMGALLSLVGCVAGNLLTACVLVARQEHADILVVTMAVLLNPQASLELLRVTFQLMDLLFYALGIYEGYKFSFRQITAYELQDISD